MAIDWTIHLGEVISAVAIILGAVGAYHGMKYQVRELVATNKRHEKQLDDHEERISDHEGKLNILKGAGILK